MIFVFPFLLGLPLVLADGAQTCIAIHDDQIYGRDLARVDPAWAQLPENISLGYAPLPGQQRTIGADALRNTVKAHGVEMEVAGPLCFERAMTALTTEQIRAAMETSLRDLSGSWRVSSINVARFGPEKVPEGEVVFPLSTLPPRFAGSLDDEVMWRGYVTYGKIHRAPVWAAVKITGSAKRVVAIEPLPAGQPVEPGQVRLEECTFCAPESRAARDLDLVIGRAPRNPIPAGGAILQNQLKLLPEVASGDLVRVEVEVGNARLVTEARAQMSGYLGNVIRMKNLESGNIFRATVTGKGQVAVDPGKTWIGPIKILSVRTDQE